MVGVGIYVTLGNILRNQSRIRAKVDTYRLTEHLETHLTGTNKIVLDSHRMSSIITLAETRLTFMRTHRSPLGHSSMKWSRLTVLNAVEKDPSKIRLQSVLH